MFQIAQWCDAQSRALIIGCVVLMVLVLGTLDTVTGSELAFSVFYFIPLAIAAWVGPRHIAVSISAASALISLAADINGGTRYASQLISIWNVSAHFVGFMSVSAVLICLRAQLQRADDLSHTDELTGLANSRAFRSALTAEADRSRRYRHPFTVAFIDVDDFKCINDRFGHHGGDIALRAIAISLRKNVRTVDVVARIGGDEFVILFPETGAMEAVRALTSFSSRVERALRGCNGSPTLSIGATTFYTVPATVELLMQDANQRMYDVKLDGKAGLAHHVVGHPSTQHL